MQKEDEGSLRSQASGELVEREPRPVYGDPSVGYDNYGEDGDEPQDFYAGWDLSFGCKVSFGYVEGRLRASVSMSDHDLRNGCSIRSITREQLNSFAGYLRQVVALGGTNEAWWTDDDERTYKVRVCDVETVATIKLDDGETREVKLNELRPMAADPSPKATSAASPLIHLVTLSSDTGVMGEWQAFCHGCRETATGDMPRVAFWRDQHEADTLQVQANSKLEQNLDLDEGRPAASEPPAAGEADTTPRVWRDNTGDLWRDTPTPAEPFLVLIDHRGEAPEFGPPSRRSDVERAWGPLTEVSPSPSQGGGTDG